MVARLLGARRIFAVGRRQLRDELAGAAREGGDQVVDLIEVDHGQADVIDGWAQTACGQVRHYLGIDPGWSHGPWWQVSPEAEVVAGPAGLWIG